jgi:hypothetical protein
MRYALFVCLGLILLNAAVYSQIRTFDFVNYDDGVHVYNNLPIQRGLTGPGVEWAFTSVLISNYIPITTMTYLFDFQFHGLDPAAYHLTNLLFHAANSLLLFWVLFRLSSALWPSALVAALFAVHPLHVESVAWISARKDVVSTFFGLLVVWSYAPTSAGRDSCRTWLRSFCLRWGSSPNQCSSPFPSYSSSSITGR